MSRSVLQAAQAAEAIGLTDHTSALDRPTTTSAAAGGSPGFNKDELLKESRSVLTEAREGLSHIMGAGTDKARHDLCRTALFVTLWQFFGAAAEGKVCAIRRVVSSCPQRYEVPGEQKHHNMGVSDWVKEKVGQRPGAAFPAQLRRFFCRPLSSILPSLTRRPPVLASCCRRWRRRMPSWASLRRRQSTQRRTGSTIRLAARCRSSSRRGGAAAACGRLGRRSYSRSAR